MASPLAAMLAATHPAIPGVPQETVATTPVSQIYQNSYENQMAKYKADLAQKNAMFGGLAGIGGAGLNFLGRKDSVGNIGTNLGSLGSGIKALFPFL